MHVLIFIPINFIHDTTFFCNLIVSDPGPIIQGQIIEVNADTLFSFL